MRTLGIDLASQPKNTAACVIEWGAEGAAVRVLSCGWDDRRLIEEIARADKTGIDAPFGWPEPFVQALNTGRWSAPGEPRVRFERRSTDVLVHQRTGKLPMSVSTDRIAYCAMRCAVIIGEAPRDGSGNVVEAYPDASLRCWLPELMPWVSYKRAMGRTRRETLVRAVLEAIPALALGEFARVCADSDDCLDALICALIARAAARNRTVTPETPEEQRLARVEGWIHLPHPGSLGRLI